MSNKTQISIPRTERSRSWVLGPEIHDILRKKTHKVHKAKRH